MQKWINELKIAIAEENADEIVQLFSQKGQNQANLTLLAKNATPEELLQITQLSNEALKIIEREKNNLAIAIKKIKTAKQFGFNFTQEPTHQKRI